MEDFNLEQRVDEDILRSDKSGPELLRYPLYNKGTAFTLEERRRLGIEGLLPAEYNTIDQQARRIYKSIFFNRDDVGRNIGLAMLQDRNEVLFYKLLSEHLEDAMPVVYTPTVGKASQYYSRVFRRGRGIFITPDYRGRVEDVLRSAAPFSDVRLMVVTDNEAILGIGDQGAGGMAISVGKLALYCAGAGIHPARTLPISLDVGTDNQALLDDPLYLGYRKPRLRGPEYMALLDEFVAAAKAVFPKVVIQWEDFSKDNALTILDRYRNEVPSFNDDIQGTGAVASACVRAGCHIAGEGFSASRILIYGAGAAGLGIARQLRSQLSTAGVSHDDLTRAVLVMDSRGIVTSGRAGLDDYKKELAWPTDMVAGLKIAEAEYADLAAVVDGYQPTIIIGASGQASAFDEAVIRNMSAHTDSPVILPMSNPTSISEAIPEDLLRWSDGRALVATGSPFGPVDVDGEKRRIGQANNVFVFPGIGLGAIASGASEITDAMIGASSLALADSLSDNDIVEKSLLPSVAGLWDICGNVALAVARQAVKDGVATRTVGLAARVESARWRPRYPAIETDPRR
ncbi:MAG: NAD-dependent malic enzyme [Gammaproteobacteria bacterium]|nr:NAD-dependent malic enzyme [Gammaproteobacteria bacterium]